jgi:hypothetical protein
VRGTRPRPSPSRPKRRAPPLYLEGSDVV